MHQQSDHRDVLEKLVLDKLGEHIFDEKTEQKNGKKTALENSIKKYDKDIDTLVTLITKTPSEWLIERLNKLEYERAEQRGYHSLNLIKYEKGWAKFITKMPPPIK